MEPYESMYSVPPLIVNTCSSFISTCPALAANTNLSAGLPARVVDNTESTGLKLVKALLNRLIAPVASLASVE